MRVYSVIQVYVCFRRSWRDMLGYLSGKIYCNSFSSNDTPLKFWNIVHAVLYKTIYALHFMPVQDGAVKIQLFKL